MGDFRLLLAFIVSLAVVIFMVMKKFVPSFCLFVGAIIAAIIAGIPLGDIPKIMNTSYGNILISTGILMLFAFVYTQYLNESGGIVELAKALIRFSGPKYDLVAIALVGYILSIPVGLLASVAIISPMLKPMSKLTGKPLAAYTTAFIVPSLLTACTVVPTSGPVLIAGLLGLNLGWYMLWGIVLTLPLAVISTLLAYWIAKKYKNTAIDFADEEGDVLDLSADPNRPSPSLMFILILIPIVLIILGSFAPIIFSADSAITGFLKFVGDPGLAMFFSTLVSMITLSKYLPRSSSAVFAEGVRESGPILVILGCAATYGGVLQASGVGSYIVSLLSGFNMPVLLIACILMVALHAGTGAGTIAAGTVIPLLLPMFQETGTSLMLFGLLMGVGQLIFLIPTDATFWFVKESCNLTESETAWSMCVPAGIVGILGFFIILILNGFATSIPGMF